ncbi:N-acetylmuramoyl-L-alanine amidase LytC precursor [Oxobacter pfennigii]|uniref:N-acetylmuramoyl-L-alanine amidase LytC n=1 Tax=Oxobacter pfennigii TaxID=36849 RepID=A0A0P8YYY8_9CLOT|nr:cell wall-binding repeat-containing protein [Oxobacter pfennigii]KPU45020.1 N-acetylmuramoyl-L-alanine amidase LytC precursor [Oxobacter pfennigii]
MHKNKILIHLCFFILTFLTATFYFTNDAFAAEPEFNRLYGQDRYATNLSITKNGWTDASNIVIASGEDFPDALCAAPLAKAKNAPIILSQREKLNDAAIDEIKRLKAVNAYIIGGTGVISENIEDQLKSLGIAFVRLAGNDRYQTSVKVAELLGTENGVVVATGENFPDALGIAPISAKLGMPILLSSKDALPADVSVYLKGKNVPASYVVGGIGVLSDNVKSSLNNPKRLDGIDRYYTNINILVEFEKEIDFTSVYVASGDDFPDALSGSVLAANSGSPIVLVSDLGVESTLDFLETLNSSKVNILGGTGAVTAGIENDLKNIMKHRIITKVDDLSDVAFIGEDYHFPDNAMVMYDDSSLKLIPVKWNSNSLDTSKKGTYDFEGTIAGYSGKVKLNTRVIEETGSLNGNLENGGYVAYYKGDLYYNNYLENYYIYKHGKNGMPHTKISNESAVYISIVNDWIYYKAFDDSSKLRRMRLDGTEVTTVVNESVSAYYVVGEWIYYTTNTQGKSDFYMMKEDGSNKTRISGDDIGYIVESDDYLYYENISDNGTIWKMKLDGSNRKKVSVDSGYSINIIDGWIYYVNISDNKKIYKIKTDGTGRVIVCDDSVENFNIYNGWIYYSNRSDNSKFYRIRTDGTDKSKFLDTRVGSIMIFGELIVYQSNDGSSTLYMAKLDGSASDRFAINYVYDKESNDDIGNAQDYRLIVPWEYSYEILGSLENNDTDIYRIQPNLNSTLTIVFVSVGIGNKAEISFLDEWGNSFGSIETSSDGAAYIEVPNLLPGTYYIKVSSKQGLSMGTNKYNLISWRD